MAKKSPAARPLAGRTVAFVGKFGYQDSWRGRYVKYATAAGARVVEPGGAVAPDYLVAGEGRGGKPPGDVAKVTKAFPAVQVLRAPDFCRLVVPDREALLARLAKTKLPDDWWDQFDSLLREAGARADLTNADLGRRELFGAKLERADLDGADLRGARFQYGHFPARLRAVTFDGAYGEDAYFGDLERCSFRDADLTDAWFFYGQTTTVAGCDFTGAKLAEARAEGGTFTDCAFAGANLSDLKAEKTKFPACDFTKADLSRVHAPRGSFARAVLVGATLRRADLRNASLAGADLRNADLRDAALGGADLTGARVDGADFTGAALSGATLAKVDVKKAKNLAAQAARTPGPKLTELAAAAAGAKVFQTAAVADVAPGEFAELEVMVTHRGPVYGTSRFNRGGDTVHDNVPGKALGDVLLALADRWPNATLRLDAVTAGGSKTLRGAKLKELARAAWAEAFGVATDDLTSREEAQRAAALAERDRLFADVRAKGPAVWDRLDYRARERVSLAGLDLSGASVPGITLWSRKDLAGAKFAGADLAGAKFHNSDLRGADFTGAKLRKAGIASAKLDKASFRGADLTGAELARSKLPGADLRDADLTGADLSKADLRGADLTGATLAKAKLDGVRSDAETKWPARFTPPAERAGAAAAAFVPGSLDFPAFAAGLPQTVDAGRLANARSMLKAEKFQLFAEVSDDAVVGVVKSQSSPDRVYACRVTADGRFGCGTQNLRPCGGLAGAACKHILVLVVGLAKAGRLDPAAAAAWLAAARARAPEFDKERMSETFLRYKGAEAGEVDWRPTETLPEDFYAL